ncbi:MAG TPA: multidrug efflux RND transporter permease subunit [Gemmatimonadales bacterium]|nr:multidrug efflux RND transporter permease subunit [Gemmatimonadales bacterium]
MTQAPRAGGEPPVIRYFFIRRPVLAAVISIVIVLLGGFCLLQLPIARYPQITPPAVQVSAVYPGATAEDVAQAVAAPIEQQLSGLDGLLYYRSSNSSSGIMNLQVYFDISRDPDLAAVDVQNAIKVAEPQLPEEVRRQGVTIRKSQTDILLVASLYSDDPRFDATYLTNYAKLYVVDELKRLNGVGDATAFGGLDFAMTIRLDPDRMAQLGLTVGDVRDAVQEQNATNPAGTLGREPAPAGTEFTLPVTALGRLQTADQFADIIVRAQEDGSFVRVRDIGTVELTSQNLDLIGRFDGKPTANILIYLRPGANQLEVREAFQHRMEELALGFPAGVKWQVPFDATPFVTASIEEVAKTLGEAMLLVTLVVFLFLQSWRATLIPILAVPVSVIGTFLGLFALGYSINVLTLFALVLAIGIVVDDAIVVIENVERIMDEEKLPAPVAADRAMQQVASALVAIVLVLCSVFVPVAFLGGITGTMLRQFAVTLVVAVVLSGLVALTLTPALCALLLKETPHETHNRFFRRFNDLFDRTTAGYSRNVGRVLRRPRAWLAAFAVLLALTFVLFRNVPRAFIPTEDKGFFVIAIQLPDGASRQRTDKVVERVEGILRKDPAVEHFVDLVGFNLLAQANQPNGATIFINLKDWSERGKEDALDNVLGRVNGQLFGLKDALAFGFNFPEIPGLGSTAGLELNLQARSGQDIQTFSRQVQAAVADIGKLPETPAAATTFRAEVPQVFVQVDRETAKARGVKLGDLFASLQAMLSSLYINDFNLYGRTYKVQAEAQPRFRQTPEDLGRLYVRAEDAPDKEMIPLSALIRTEFRGAPSVLSRFNGFTSALVTASAPPGVSSGQQLDAVEQLLRTKYEPQGLGFAYSGQSFQERASGGDAGLVFGLGLILVFLVLAAQYESWSIPFAVILGVPFGVLGAFLGVWLRDIPSDIYFQVGLITVVGLAAKNAILIVEFANALRAQGAGVIEAATEAARERFRPILMTSFAFILGVAPLTIATGAGAASRHSLGTAVFFGMLGATLVAIFFIPLFFAVIRGLAERFGRRTHAAAAPASSVEEGA